jgi:hypothetical protein
MEVASYWQSPGWRGIGMAQFASTGTVTDALLDDIAREAGDPANAEDMPMLMDLGAYVNACTVPVWVVGRNVAGYLPESDVTAYLDYAEAVEAHRDEVQEAPEQFFADEDGDCGGGECVDGGELCDFHGWEAAVGAYLKDGAPYASHGRVYAEPRESSFAIRPDHLPVFSLARSERLVADFLAERSI